MMNISLFGYANYEDAEMVYVLREKDITPAFLKDIINIMHVVDTEDYTIFFEKAKITFLSQDYVFTKFLEALSAFSESYKLYAEITITSENDVEENARLLRETCINHKEIGIHWNCGDQWKEVRKKVWTKAGVAFLSSRHIREYKPKKH